MSAQHSLSSAEERLSWLHDGYGSPLIALRHRVVVLEKILEHKCEKLDRDSVDEALWALAGELQANVKAVEKIISVTIDLIEKAEK